MGQRKFTCRAAPSSGSHATRRVVFCLAPMEGVAPEIFANKLAQQLAGKPIEFLLEELRERRKGELEIRTRTQTKLKHSPPFARNIRRLTK
ncbi:hypothetical protein Q5P01_014399 [Channa striata]|uniref:Uncharacterized protein n=1 Tax=Channa striata TaxID=64152 RepID=A0AA88SHQ1_CHASR|nr:hypothetical protein Q5P01_014399 [Channa striata]